MSDVYRLVHRSVRHNDGSNALQNIYRRLKWDANRNLGLKEGINAAGGVWPYGGLNAFRVYGVTNAKHCQRHNGPRV